MVVGSLLDQPFRPIVVLLALSGVITFAVKGIREYLAEIGVERDEHGVGYTTLRRSRYRDLWQLDPRTGTVLRRPGEKA
jgi:hypothetical protein